MSTAHVEQQERTFNNLTGVEIINPPQNTNITIGILNSEKDPSMVKVTLIGAQSTLSTISCNPKSDVIQIRGNSLLQKESEDMNQIKPELEIFIQIQPEGFVYLQGTWLKAVIGNTFGPVNILSEADSRTYIGVIKNAIIRQSGRGFVQVKQVNGSLEAHVSEGNLSVDNGDITKLFVKAENNANVRVNATAKFAELLSSEGANIHVTLVGDCSYKSLNNGRIKFGLDPEKFQSKPQ